METTEIISNIQNLPFGKMFDYADDSDLNSCLTRLQTDVGIEEGDTAGIFFADIDEDEWPNFKFSKKLRMLAEYLAFELLWQRRKIKQW